MARIRHIFDTSEIPRLWLYDGAEDGWARNKQNNLSYNRRSLRSYATEIARKVDIPCQRRERQPSINGYFPHTMVLLSDARYSNTSSQHVSAASMYLQYQSNYHVVIPVRGAPWGGKILSYGSRDDFIPISDRKDIVQWHAQQRDEYLGKASRARENKEWLLQRASEWEWNREVFQRYFPIPGKTKEKRLTLDTMPQVDLPTSDEEVRKLLMDFTNPVSKRNWMTPTESMKFTRSVALPIITQGIFCKHIRYKGGGQASISTTFATLVTKYPQELKTICEMQEAMNL